jgi:hypothetical protein
VTAQQLRAADELHVLAAAAHQLSLQDCQQLEQQANELSRQLLALKAHMKLNQAGLQSANNTTRCACQAAAESKGHSPLLLWVTFAHSHSQSGHEHKVPNSYLHVRPDAHVCATV